MSLRKFSLYFTPLLGVTDFLTGLDALAKGFFSLKGEMQSCGIL